MYKESQEILRVSIDEARKEGRKQLVKGSAIVPLFPQSLLSLCVRVANMFHPTPSSYPVFLRPHPSDLVMWMKRRGRRGRHFRREELLAFLSGKAPPPASSSMRQNSGGAPSGVTGASSAAVALGANHHLHHHHHPHHRKSSAALFSSQFLAEAGGGSNAPHGRRSLSASPSLTEANLWMTSSSDFSSSAATNTTGYFHVDGKIDANSNNNNNQSSGLFLEPDLRSFRDAQAVSYYPSELLCSAVIPRLVRSCFCVFIFNSECFHFCLSILFLFLYFFIYCDVVQTKTACFTIVYVRFHVGLSVSPNDSFIHSQL